MVLSGRDFSGRLQRAGSGPRRPYGTISAAAQPFGDRKEVGRMLEHFINGQRTTVLRNQVFQKVEDYCQTRHSNVVTIFREIDKDQSGTLTGKELDKQLSAWGLNLHKDEIDAVVKSFDDDADAEISFGEMFEAISEYKAAKRQGVGSGKLFDPRDATKKYTPGFTRESPPFLGRSRRIADHAFAHKRANRYDTFRMPSMSRPESCLHQTGPGRGLSRMSSRGSLMRAPGRAASQLGHTAHLPAHLPMLGSNNIRRATTSRNATF